MASSNGRSADSRRSPRSAAQWLLGLLILLALIASVLMVFTDKLSIAGSVAVIAALWAAVIGAIGVTKYRRQADTAEAKSRDLRLVYELQLEREITARRQYELDVESTIRQEIAAESGAELLELQAQVAALRASLEQLIGGPLPEERVALPNERLRELASGIGTNLYSHDDRSMAAQDFASTAPASADGRHQPNERFHYDIPRSEAHEMTEIIPVVTDDDAEPMTQAYSAVVTDDPDTPMYTEESPTDSWKVRPRGTGQFGEHPADEATGAADVNVARRGPGAEPSVTAEPEVAEASQVTTDPEDVVGAESFVDPEAVAGPEGPDATAEGVGEPESEPVVDAEEAEDLDDGPPGRHVGGAGVPFSQLLNRLQQQRGN